MRGQALALSLVHQFFAQIPVNGVGSYPNGEKGLGENFIGEPPAHGSVVTHHKGSSSKVIKFNVVACLDWRIKGVPFGQRRLQGYKRSGIDITADRLLGGANHVSTGEIPQVIHA